jgi:hypothetical protein
MNDAAIAKRIAQASTAANAPIKLGAKIITIRRYLKLLLREVWVEDETFSGKRPFGESGWKFDVYAALIKAKAIDGKLDADGYAEEFDMKDADELVLDVIESLS